jgi:hypothetical protein
MSSPRAASGRSTVITAALHAVIQVVALGLAMLAWRRSPGWTSGQWFLYFTSLTLITPAIGRLVARSVLRLDHPLQVWRAWAVSLFTLVVLLFGEGLSEAGVSRAVVLTIMGGLAFFGGLASSWPAKPA